MGRPYEGDLRVGRGEAFPRPLLACAGGSRATQWVAPTKNTRVEARAAQWQLREPTIAAVHASLEEFNDRCDVPLANHRDGVVIDVNEAIEQRRGNSDIGSEVFRAAEVFGGALRRNLTVAEIVAPPSTARASRIAWSPHCLRQ
jgi:hypothetical protein